MNRVLDIERCWVCKTRLHYRDDWALYCPIENTNRLHMSYKGSHFLVKPTTKCIWILIDKYWILWDDGFFSLEEINYQDECVEIVSSKPMTIDIFMTMLNVEAVQNFMVLS